MGFIKIGDATPILNVLTAEELKKEQEKLKKEQEEKDKKEK